MNAKEIRTYCSVHSVKSMDITALDLSAVFLAEIAAQLAEMNEARRWKDQNTRSPLGHAPGCDAVAPGPNYCGRCGGYIGK